VVCYFSFFWPCILHNTTYTPVRSKGPATGSTMCRWVCGGVGEMGMPASVLPSTTTTRYHPPSPKAYFCIYHNRTGAVFGGGWHGWIAAAYARRPLSGDDRATSLCMNAWRRAALPFLLCMVPSCKPPSGIPCVSSKAIHPPTHTLTYLP
jgi:hypothetical protein